MKTALFAIGFLVLNLGNSNLSWAGQPSQDNQTTDCACSNNGCFIHTAKGAQETGVCQDQEVAGTIGCYKTGDTKKTIITYCAVDVTAGNNVECNPNDSDINAKTKSGYGCKYGGANGVTTKSINTATNEASGVMDKVGQMSVQNANANATETIYKQGVNATGETIAAAQASTLSKAAEMQTTAGMVNGGLAGTQAMRAQEHLKSIKKVLTNSNAAIKTNLASAMGIDSSNISAANGSAEAGYHVTVAYTAPVAAADTASLATSSVQFVTCSTTPGKPGAVIEAKITCNPGSGGGIPIFAPAGGNALDVATIQNVYNQKNTNRVTNTNGEVEAQKQLAGTEGMAAAVTGFKAMTDLEQASMDRSAAAATVASASNFSFNPGTGGGYSGDGTTTDPTPAPGQTLTSGDGSAANLPGASQINPNPNNDLGGVAPAGAFTPATAAAAAPGSPPAMGTAGGTSPAKDDPANKDNSKPSATAVGSYSAGDTPTGYNRNGGNSGPSVGLDTSFADMMKKFLPGGDEEKKPDGSANFNDRTPASDAATVIARNKNIFEEVHKRYEKKNTEGAIVF